MTDKTELTRESLAEYLQHCGPDDQYEPLVRQLLAAMDDRDRHLNNLGRFVSQVAMALGLPATSAPEVVLRQAAVTFDGAHRYANERDRLQAELAEARATLAAERGEAEGAPSEGWEHEFGYEGEHSWRKRVSGAVAVISGAHGASRWEVMPLDEDGDVDWSRGNDFREGEIPSETFREGMKLADAALATMEPPDAST